MTIRTPKQWNKLFNEQKQSGQSAAAFCRERGLCPKYFSKRRKQFLNADVVPPATQSAFVPVTVTKPMDGRRVELHLGDALVLTLPSSISPAWLADLVQQLRP